MNASVQVLSRTSVILGVAFLVSFESSAGQGGAGRVDPISIQTPSFQRVDRLVGMDLQDSTGASIGRVEELILHADGSIGSLVVEASVHGRTRLYPISWQAIQFETSLLPPSAGTTGAGGRLMTDFTSDRLEFAPSFVAEQWPERGMESVFSSADKFWIRGVATRAPRARLRSTTLPNRVITDTSGAPLGTLGQVVADPMNGRVTYASVHLRDGRVVAVPWALFQVSPDQKESFRLSIPYRKLQNAPEFLREEDQWKSMSDPAWVEDVYSYYSVPPYWKRDTAEAARKNLEPTGG